MQSISDHYIVEIETIFEKESNGLVTSVGEEALLLTKTDAQKKSEGDKVRDEVQRILRNTYMPSRRKKLTEEYLDSVGWKIENGKLFQVHKREEEASYNPNENRRCYGTILSVPIKMSDAFLYNKEEGFYDRYVDSDTIRDFKKRHNMKLEYKCSSYEPTKVTMRDIFSPRFSKGDTLYFYWHCTLATDKMISDETFCDIEIGVMSRKYIYLINAKDAICTVNNNQVSMNDTFLLIEPIMQKEEDIVSKSGIYLQTEVKAIEQMGIVRHGELKGTTVFFYDNADMKMKINSKEYYVMTENDILYSI